MNDIWLFAIGVVIFVAFMAGLLTMVNQQHKIQSNTPSEGGGKPKRKGG
jgi:hypothetical protein